MLDGLARDLLRSEGGLLGHVTGEGGRELRLVVRVDLRVIPAARHGDIREPPVEHCRAESICVHMHDHAIGGLPLATVAGDSVAVIQMSMCSWWEVTRLVPSPSRAPSDRSIRRL